MLGGALGVLYDCFRLLRLMFPAGRGMVFWQDGFFFLLSAAALFRFTLRLCSGQLRLFVLMGCLLGFFLYYGTVGALVYALAGRVMSGIREAIHRFARQLKGFFGKVAGHFTVKRQGRIGQNSQKSS